MNRFELSLLPRAIADVDAIHTWLDRRSASGATSWLDALDAAFEDLRRPAMAYGAAAEAESLDREIKQTQFI